MYRISNHLGPLLIPLQADKVTNWVRPIEGGTSGIVVTLPAKYRVSSDTDSR